MAVLNCFHFVGILLTVDCGIFSSEESSQLDLLHRWHPIMVQHWNSLSSWERSILSQMFVEAVCMPRYLDFYTCGQEVIGIPEIKHLDVFCPVSSKPSTCILDPIPTRLFKEVFPLIDTSILDLINLSLLTGYVPQTFKVAVIKPLLKKTYSWFRSVG